MKNYKKEKTAEGEKIINMRMAERRKETEDDVTGRFLKNRAPKIKVYKRRKERL